MPWGYRRVAYSRGGNTSAWNTAGETASLKNACALYDLTEEQVMAADPPIPCQWRSCHGNPYAVVKLSDMAALKSRLAEKEKEDAKAKMIEKLGEEGYAKHLAEEKAKKEEAAKAEKAQQEKAAKASELVRMLNAAMDASGNGVTDTLEGISVGKTVAKTEWYLTPDEVSKLTPVDATKKLAKYHLADVIAIAHDKSYFHHGNAGHISVRVKRFPSREKLYARYLYDKFNGQCAEVDDDIVQIACNKVRTEIEKVVKVKAEAAKKAQAELVIEENRLSAFDELVEDARSNMGQKREAAGKGESGTTATAKKNRVC